MLNGTKITFMSEGGDYWQVIDETMTAFRVDKQTGLISTQEMRVGEPGGSRYVGG